MNALFEYMDRLNAPFECFEMGDDSPWFPVHSHWHYYLEVIYIVCGSAMVTCDDQTFIARVGDLVLALPHQIHSIFSLANMPFRCLVMKFDLGQMNPSTGQGGVDLNGIHFSSLFRLARNNPSAKLYFSEEELEGFPVEQLFRECIHELQHQEYGCRTMVRSYVTMLLTYIIRSWRRDGFDTDQSFAQQSDEESIYSITEYIDGHIQENVKVEDLAKMCNMSYSYFAKSFREVYGQSCKKYIEFVRLCKAEDLLMFTNLDLNYISQETGFADCSHFIKVFKEKYGKTPKQYRMQNVKGL